MRNNHSSQLKGDTAMVEIDCTECGEPNVIAVSSAGYLAWKFGELVQNAFPEVDRKTRELFVTGICPKCFDAMFGVRP